MRLAVIGDLVVGLASSSPPTAFVGEIGDQAADAAARLTSGMKQPRGSASPLALRIDGRPVATQSDVAVELGPNGATAFPLAWQPKLSIADKGSLVHENLFQCSPSGSLKALALRQQLASSAGPLELSPHAEPGSDDESGAPRATGSRSDFSEPSPLATMLSRCSSHRLADLIPPEYACLVGDPVDVATGAVVTDAIDFQCCAPPLRFTRRYASNRSDRDSPFGFGWSHNFDQALWLEPGRIVLRDGHGRQIEFDCGDLRDGVAWAGDELADRAGRMTLRCHGRHHYELFGADEVRSDQGCIRHFGPIPGTTTTDADRGLSRLRKVVLPNQPLTELAYDVHARLQSITVDGQSTIELRYDQSDRIVALNRDAARFEYSGSGDLMTATDAIGNARKYEYAQHLLVSESNRRGGVFYYAYDGHSSRARCIRSWGTGGDLHRLLSYDAGATVVTDSLGHDTTYHVAPTGLVERVVDPHGNATALRYDDALRLIEVRASDDTNLRDEYDDQGQLVRLKREGEASWGMRYDAAGRLVEGIDPMGGAWHFAYDFGGRLSRVEAPDGHTTRMEYESGQLCRLIDPLGTITHVTLGRGDEVTEVRVEGTPATTFAYDRQGRLTTCQSDTGGEYRWSYDANGRVSATQSELDYLRVERDAEGSVTGLHGRHHTWTLRRDPFGQVVAMTDGEHERSYEYDTERRLVRAASAGRTRWEVRRDECGLIQAAVVDGSRDCVVLRQANAKHIVRMRWPDRVVSIAWDAGARIREVADGQDTRTFSYRPDGLLSAYANEAQNTTLTRNARGVVMQQDHGGRIINSEHVDHSGTRYGLVVSDAVSISYLWATDRELDRIAVTANGAFDLAVTRIGQHLEVRHDGRQVAIPQDDTSTLALDYGEQVDALLRPLRTADGSALLWDEGRLLLRGDTAVINEPRTGQPLAEVAEGTLTLHEAPGGATPPATASPDAEAYEALFPVLPRLSGPEPLELLRAVFSVRAWNPVVRPVAGTHPWDPEAWRVVDCDPQAPQTRLDRTTLMRLLSPFPREPLSVPR